MRTNKLLKQKLDSLGAVLVRSNKHEIWQLPNGWKVTIAHTASDQRAVRNQIKDLDRTAAREAKGAPTAAQNGA